MKVIYVLLACLLVFASCAETDYAENGVDRKDITGYTEIGFYSLDGVYSIFLSGYLFWKE